MKENIHMYFSSFLQRKETEPPGYMSAAMGSKVSSPAGRYDSMALLYVGSVLPDTPEYLNAAFSRAGTMFQANLLRGMKHAGLAPSTILSYRQIPSFPGSRRLWIGPEKTSLGEGIAVTLMPFLNVSPVKQMILGLCTMAGVLLWGWRMRLKSYKVVYTFNLTVPPGIFTWIAARLIGAKAVVSLNDINKPGHTVPDTLFNRLDYWLQQILIPLFDGHVAVADSIMQDFAPGRQYVRLEGGVTAEMLRHMGSAGKRKGSTEAPFTIVSAGSLDDANGFRVLLEAFSLLKGSEYRLCIAGGGPLAAEIRQAAAKDARIKFYGFISVAEVLALYRSADLLINMRLTKLLNTKYFFPSKMMEYLASGTPVVSTCTGHIEEEFGDLVFLLRDETPEGLVEMIEQVKMLEPQLLIEKGAKAREYMEKHKTWDAQGFRVAAYIRSLFDRDDRKDD